MHRKFELILQRVAVYLVFEISRDGALVAVAMASAQQCTRCMAMYSDAWEMHTRGQRMVCVWYMGSALSCTDAL